MAATPSPDTATLPKQDEWDQTEADVKKLVKALHFLMSSTPPANPGPEQPKAIVVSYSKNKTNTEAFVQIDTA